MAAEDRKQARNLLRADHEVLLCHIQLAGEQIPISTIFDISEAGAGIATSAPLPAGATVDLRYRGQAGEDITVAGKVAWCAPACASRSQTQETLPLAGYRGGIYFGQAEQRSRDRLVGALRPLLDLEALCV